MSLDDEFVSVGVVMRMPYNKIKSLAEYLKENGIEVIYNKATLGRLKIQEMKPQSTTITEVEGRDDF